MRREKRTKKERKEITTSNASVDRKVKVEHIISTDTNLCVVYFFFISVEHAGVLCVTMGEYCLLLSSHNTIPVSDS